MRFKFSVVGKDCELLAAIYCALPEPLGEALIELLEPRSGMNRLLLKALLCNGGHTPSEEEIEQALAGKEPVGRG